MPSTSIAYSWDLEQIMAARDAQILGRFAQPVRLATSMRTDDALYVAHANRLAPLRALPVVLDSRGGRRGDTVAGEARALFGERGLAVPQAVLTDANSDLANHGIAIGRVEWIVRGDGARVDPLLEHWPLDTVSWDPLRRMFWTTADNYIGEQPVAGVTRAGFIPIVHGDGEWIVFRSSSERPWTKSAALLPASLVWACHAFTMRDWSKGSSSHGNAKVLGQLPEGMRLQDVDADGALSVSPEAQAFAQLLTDVASLDTPVGISPAGAKIDYLTNGSRAWEVWRELASNRERAAARIYLGTDGTLGAQGGAPGVDIQSLFGVATTIIQGDARAIETGIQEGLLEPWAALNFGTSDGVPLWHYVIPDADHAASVVNRSAADKALCDMVASRRAAGFEVTQAWVDDEADRLGVARLQLAATTTSGVVLAPTDVAKIVRVNEGRAALGLAPDEEGGKWIAEIGASEDEPEQPRSALRAV